MTLAAWRCVAALLCAALPLSTPGPSAWAAGFRVVLPEMAPVHANGAAGSIRMAPSSLATPPSGSSLSLPSLKTSALGGLNVGLRRQTPETVSAEIPAAAVSAQTTQPAELALRRRKVASRMKGIARAAAAPRRAAASSESSPSRLRAAGGKLGEILLGSFSKSRSSAEPVPVSSRWSSPFPSVHGDHDHFEIQSDFDDSVPEPLVSPEKKSRFKNYMSGVAVVKIGLEAMHIAIPVLFLTQFGTALGVASLVVAADLAGMVFGWASGPLIDRFRPSRVLAVVTVLSAFVVAGIPLALLSGSASAMPVVAGLFISAGGLTGVFDIARRAEMPQILGRDERTLCCFNGRLYFRREIAAILGDAGIGGIAKTVGYISVIWLHPISYLLSAFLFWRAGGPKGSPRVRPEKKSLRTRLSEGWEELTKGARTVWADPKLRIAALINVPVLAIHRLFHVMLAAVYAVHVLGDPAMAAVLLLAWNAGELAAAWVLEKHGGVGSAFKWLRYGAAMGLLTWLYVLTPSIWLAAPAAFFIATATLTNELGLASFFQAATDKEEIGAVTAFIYSLSTLGSMLALLVMGLIFRSFSPQIGFAVLAVAATIASLVYLVAWRCVSRLPKHLVKNFMRFFHAGEGDPKE